MWGRFIGTVLPRIIPIIGNEIALYVKFRQNRKALKERNAECDRGYSSDS